MVLQLLLPEAEFTCKIAYVMILLLNTRTCKAVEYSDSSSHWWSYVAKI